jgi:hypothetical protein
MWSGDAARYDALVSRPPPGEAVGHDRSEPRDIRRASRNCRARRGRRAANSTVDDWLGQQASEDEEVVDELRDETGGDIDEAERRFPARSHQDRPGRLPTDRRRT